MDGFLIFLAALLVVVLTVVARGVRTVPQGFQWTVERFGRYRITLQPGLHLINPFIDNIGRKVNVQETVLEVPAQNVITRDNASVMVDGIVFYQVLGDSEWLAEGAGLSAGSTVVVTAVRGARLMVRAADVHP